MTIRIALFGFPDGAAEVLESTLRTASDFVLIARPHKEIDLLLTCADLDVVVVAAGRNGCRSATVERILDVKADICVLAFDWRGRRAWTIRKEGRQRELPAPNLDDLAATIRSAALPPPECFFSALDG